LSQTNESATVAKTKNFPQLNKPKILPAMAFECGGGFFVIAAPDEPEQQ